MIETNFEKLGKQIENIGERLYKRAQAHPGEVRKELTEFGRKVRNSITTSMMLEPKTGILYKYKGRRYRASAPGQSPAVRSGKLVRAIAYSVRRSSEIEVGVLKRAYYAKYLEPGTEKGFRNRPFLLVNVNKHWPATHKRIAQILCNENKNFVLNKRFHYGGFDRLL